MAPLLQINDLSVGFTTPTGLVRAVDGVSLSIERGQTVGLVGESGCGKSATAFSILQLLPRPSGRILGGQILFHSSATDVRDLATLSQKDLCAIRGRDIAMIFQEPMSALNPVMKIGHQVAEGLRIHRGMALGPALQAAQQMLARVGIDQPAQRMRAYPHQLSGGQRQRVVIAMALICQPQLIIADEPTTALDAMLQLQVLQLLGDLQKSSGAAILFITHDLGLVRSFCHTTAVMYAGQVVESGPTDQLFSAPAHPYTAALLRSRPAADSLPKSALPTIPGRLPSFAQWGTGCRFAPRCSFATSACQQPQLLSSQASRSVRCVRAAQLHGQL